jgi:hypothetical protein
MYVLYRKPDDDGRRMVKLVQIHGPSPPANVSAVSLPSAAFDGSKYIYQMPRSRSSDGSKHKRKVKRARLQQPMILPLSRKSSAARLQFPFAVLAPSIF